MKDSNLQKVFEIIKKTGDRCIVIDNPHGSVYVVMTLDDYEALIQRKGEIANLSEKEFLEKINRDIALWKSAQENDIFEDWELVVPKKNINDANLQKDNDKEDVYYFEPID